MKNKRLEIYVGWTCNQRCTYCMEFHNMTENWSKKVSKFDILKKLLKYKKLGYNHVTYLGGEPFIQEVFLDALKIGKMLGYSILITTNCTTLHIEAQAKKFLPYIDELFLSVEAIDIEKQQEISRVKSYVHWDGVFANIGKYWKGTLLKGNIVITQDNKNNILDLVTFLSNNGVKNISITYPDIDLLYYGIEHILEKVAPSYQECMAYIEDIVSFCEKNHINLKIVDFPFCVFPPHKREKYAYLTDDYDYSPRMKIDYNENEQNRILFKNVEDIPRERVKTKKCQGCVYKSVCWGYSRWYRELYGLSEINAVVMDH